MHQQIANEDEHNKAVSVILGEDADVYGDVESEERDQPGRQNEPGKDPAFPGGDGGIGYSHVHEDGDDEDEDGYADAGGNSKKTLL